MHLLISLLVLLLGGAFAADDRLDLRDLDIAPGRWTPREPAQVGIAAADRPGSTRFEIRPGGAEWTVVEGPLIPVAKRSRFCKDRVFALTVQAQAESGDGYVLQIRLRQGKGGATFTRNLSPHWFWESTAELDKAEKWRQWSPLTGSSGAGSWCDTLAVELWFRTPKAAPAVISLAGLSIAESFSTAHLLGAKPSVPGGIFFAEQGAAEVELVDAEAVTSCRLAIADANGRLVGGSDGGPGTGRLAVALPGRGFYAVSATAAYAGRPEVSARTTMAVVGAPLDDVTRQASRFGSMRVWGSGDLWRQSGANWDWMIGGVDLGGYVLEADGSIHPPEGAKPFAYPREFQAVATFRSFPRWLHGRDGDGLFPPRDWAQLERLAEAFARANPDLTRICPYNEPDAHWRGSAEEFVRFHQAIYAGLKRGNPALQVVGPGMYSIRMDDIRKYDALGLLDAQDGMTMHAYVNATPPEDEFIANIQALTAHLRRRGKGGQPLYLTEFGWCSEVGDWQKPLPEMQRTRYLARSLALVATQPVDCIAYFCFLCTKSLDKPEYSLLYRDHSPTPGYVAFVQALRWLSWTQRGDGAWLRLSPSLNLTMFDNGTRSVAVAWSGQGPGTIRLPAPPRRCEDLFGRPLPVPADGVLAVAPEAVYAEMAPDAAFRALERLAPVEVPPGAAVPLPWPAFFAPPELACAEGRAVVAADARPGDYLVLGRAGGAWQAQPIRVLAPLTLAQLDYALAPDGSRLIATASLATALREPARVELTIALDQGGSFAATGTVAPAATGAVAAAIPGFELGRRYQGTVRITLLGAVPWTIERRLDQTVMACPRVAAVDWAAVPPVDISAWAPRPGPLPREDCSATARTAIADDGFHLLVEVTDDIHWQGQGPAGMWQEDSVQVAIDADADRPWQPNNVGNGFNGHRIVEYGLAHPSKGGPAMVWRYRADVPDMKANCAEPRIQATVERKGATTRYEATLPWAALGLAEAPPAGTQLGFALVVNDADKSYQRKFLQLFEGIATGKDPERFGRLRITAP